MKKYKFLKITAILFLSLILYITHDIITRTRSSPAIYFTNCSYDWIEVHRNGRLGKGLRLHLGNILSPNGGGLVKTSI